MLRWANKGTYIGFKNIQTAHYARQPSTRSDTSTRPRTRASTEYLTPRGHAIRMRTEEMGTSRATRHYQTSFGSDVTTSADDEIATRILIARPPQAKL